MFLKPHSALKRWMDALDNNTYAALTFKGGAAFRKQLAAGTPTVPRTPRSRTDMCPIC